MYEWISVEDRLPNVKEAEDNLLLFLSYYRGAQKEILVGYYHDHGLWNDKNDWPISTVTHWMPLPDPPEASDV